MKFLALLPVLPLVAAGVVASPGAELATTSGKVGAVRKLFTLKTVIELAPGGGQIRGMGSGQNVRISGRDLCGDCTVLEGQIKLTNPDGSPVDEKVVYNHHILTNNMAATPFPLKSSSFMSTPMSGGFVGAGGDNGNSPFMYYDPASPPSEITGYQITSRTNFIAQVVLVNKSSKKQSITINYELEYVPKVTGESVQSALISATVVPNANGKSTSGVMTWEKSGTFLFGKGHLHDGGEAMRMWFYRKGENTATAKAYYECESKATYSGGAIVGMNACKAQKVKAGDQVIMQSQYSSKEHGSNSVAGGNMAMFRMIFAS